MEKVTTPIAWRDRVIDYVSPITFALSALFVIGVVLRFVQLGAESYWVDEIIMGRLTTQPTPDLLAQLFDSARAPLYPLLAHGWVKLFGASEAASRSISAVFGALSIPLVYAVGRKLFDARVGLIGALIMMLSPFHLYYSQEFRYYSLTILVTLGTVWMLAHAIETRRMLHFILFAVLAIVLFYAHPLVAALTVASLGLFFLARWKAHRPVLLPWLLSQVLVALGALPTLVLRVVRSLERSADPDSVLGEGLAPAFLPDMALWEPVRTTVDFLLLDAQLLPRLPALAVLAAGALGLTLIVLRRGAKNWLVDVRRIPREVASHPSQWRATVLLLLFWYAGPVLVAYVSTLTVLPMYLDRYLSGAAPALYLLIAVAIIQLRHVVPVALSVGVLAVLLALTLQQYYVQDIKEQWDELVAYVEANAEETDALAFSSHRGLIEKATGVRGSFDWYYQGDAPQCEMDVMQPNPEAYRALQVCAGPSGRVWLVMRYSENERVAELGRYIQDEAPSADGLVEQREYVGWLGLYLLDLGTLAGTDLDR